MTPVVIVGGAMDARAAALADALQLPLVTDNIPPAGALCLQFQDDCLRLLPADARQSGPVFVDFCGGASAHRLQGGAELIVRAVRGRSREPLHVLDATAGLGRDALVLASRGQRVTLLERSPVVAALLADGLRRARDCADARVAVAAARMTLLQADAGDHLAALAPAAAPDVIYLDPMFPASDKSAQVKKEMRLFQQLLDEGSADHRPLLEAARSRARLRVVVKRPRRAPPLADLAPDYALEGKAVRFDVYIGRASESA